MIACCNDGTRPVIFKIERIDYKVLYIKDFKKHKEDIKNKNGHYYRWIGVSDCNIGCDRNEENGIFMQIDNYDYK